MTAVGIKEKCFFCQADKNTGVNVLTAFICFDCEREIAALSLDDYLKYRIFMRDIKRLWNGLGGEERVFDR
ncbi:MAG: inhibitor of sigma-G Gin [Dethiobacter sp.]|jgi:hypothetical protein|nr:MAG: inhibitor of sigma-G Gin [Dethiobacter sp.]